MKKITLFTVALVATIFIPLSVKGSMQIASAFEPSSNVVRLSRESSSILTNNSPLGFYTAVKAGTVSYFKSISDNPFN